MTCNKCGNLFPGIILGGYKCSCGNIELTDLDALIFVEDKYRK